MKPVCLVFGAGAGIGGTVAAKFAEEGYHSFLCRRSDKEGLDKFFANDGFFNLISFNFPKIFDNLLLGPSSFGVSILSFKDVVGVCV